MADLSTGGIARSVANAASSATQAVKSALHLEKNAKINQLSSTAIQDNSSGYLTTNTGVPVATVDDSLKAGERGPTLIEDFQFRDRMAHFDRERIPERVVHARGTAAHGYFEAYEDLSDLTRAAPFAKKGKRTPLFTRFSTVQGFRGSADSVRDVRGFSVKFFTEEGNWDFVGNNIPVFFIQDAIKFTDLVHALKPEPHNEIPQAQSAHDNFWDFVSLTPESTHMLMWVMSDRTIPRSLKMMQGFGVHTFRFVNKDGVSRFVKFHWRPIAGVHSLVWDEALKTAGRDPDFHRRDLWEGIEKGVFPEWELGVQVITEEEAAKFPYDILDSTKFIPEEVVPIRYIGKMVLNANPTNYFGETEQSAFHPGNVIPGIDVSNDPLLQGRLFSYTDTQFHRLGPNFHELPINRPVCPVFNHQRDGGQRHLLVKGQVNYHPNSLGGGCPAMNPHGYVHFPQKVTGVKEKKRSESFADHFSQAKMFYDSMTSTEKNHIASAFTFELSKVGTMGVRQRVVDNLNNVDHELAKSIADKIGVKVSDQAATNIAKPPTGWQLAHSLSILKSNKYDTIKGRMVAIFIMPGYDSTVAELKGALTAAGALPVPVSAKGGPVPDASGSSTTTPSFTFSASSSTQFDAIFIPGGRASVDAILNEPTALTQILEAYKHLKAICAVNEGIDVLTRLGIQTSSSAADASVTETLGVVTAHNVGSGIGGKVGKAVGTAAGAAAGGSARTNLDDGEATSVTKEFIAKFIASISKHKCWDRENAAAKVLV